MPTRRQRWFRDRRRIASAVVVALVVGTIAALSLSYRGVATADVELNDGGVWVTNNDSVLVGRLNYPVRKIDSTLAADTVAIDVMQREDEVLVLDQTQSSIRRVDSANVRFTGAAVGIPSGAEVGMGDSTVAVLDTGDGRLWVTTPGSLPIIEDATVSPTYVVGEGAHLAVADDGTVYVVDPIDNEILTFTPEVWAALSSEAAAGASGEGPDESGSATTAPPSDQPEEEGSSLAPEASVFGEDIDLTTSDVQITAVGDKPVVLARDRDSGAVTLLQPDTDPVDMSGLDADLSSAVLQASSVSGTSVAIGTTDAIVVVPLDGGEPRVIPSDQPGNAVQPVQVNGCVHAAWAGDVPTYVRVCGEGEVTPQEVPTAISGTELKFRTNRTHVVLNDLRTGDVWLLEDQLILVEDWEDVTSTTTEETETDDPSEEQTDEVPLDREAENQPPVANPDDLGARPGRTVVLPVLSNDSDPDGDLLVVESVQQPPASFGVIERILGGRALQIRMADGATGTIDLDYTINDGRENGRDSSTLTITARTPSENTAPRQIKPIEPQVVLGESIDVNILDQVQDPDGDEVYLEGADANDTVNVSLRPDGIVTLKDLAITTGPKQVVVRVSDGRGAPVPVTIDLEVLPVSEVPPQAVFDFATGFVGDRILVSPLDNDIDPNGKPLDLATAVTTTGGEITIDNDADTFTFEAGTAGSYYVLYTVTDDGGDSAQGLVRIDVLKPADAPPVAVRDTALLPPDGSVAVDVLVNDTDPSGGVLAVQTIEVPSGYGLQVAILDHRILRITSERTLTESVTIGYTVSNGTEASEGEVVVIPLTSESDTQAPTPQPDEAAVRVGDYVSIPVLRNDTHPNGLDFSISSLETGDIPGIPFVSGDLIRYSAPSEPGVYTFSYTVTDIVGQSRASTVTIYVEARGDEANAPPRPADIEVRAFAGERIRIPVDLYGIDPDGDSVVLVGPTTSPERGRIVEVGSGYLDYVAYNTVDGGTDAFQIAVRDRLGELGYATVTVGVIPPPTSNRDPVAANDHIIVRPDRPIQADVLANDTDPDGDQLQFADPAVTDDGGLEVEPVDGMLAFDSPSDRGEYAIQYAIDDTHGGRDVGTLTVTVDPDADPLPPVGVDDVVPATELIDAENVMVDVLANDYDPDGSSEDLTLEVAAGPDGVEVLPDNRLRIPVPETRQVITYKITDPDGETTYAFVEMPGLTDTGPVLRPGTELEVDSGEELLIDLDEHVVSLTDGDIQLYDNDGVTATNSNGGPYVVDDSTLTYTSADGYFGQASITFEVTDAENINDTDVLTSVLTIPITVNPTTAQPPIFRNGSLSPVAGEDPVTLDLSRLADDPDTEVSDLTFEIGDAPDGFDAELSNGVVLSVSAPIDTPPGTTAELPITISDGTNDPVEGVITLTALETRAEPIVAVDDDLGEINQGESQTVDVLSNDTDPLPPRRIIDAHVETGRGTADIQGDQVVVTPAADYDGRFVVAYTVVDATDNPDRQAQARITAVVLGAPDTPSPPRIDTVGSRQVSLDLTPPNDNGSPITSYRVTSSAGTQTCSSTSCVITGLSNGTTYTFTVVAVNAVGESEPSAASGEATPDKAPEPVAAPTVEYGDSQLSLTWTVPVNEGTDIEYYDIQISPADNSGSTQVRLDGGTTSYVWPNLTNGTVYKFRIRALNSAPDPGEYGGWSRGEYPSAPPARPAAPTMDRIDTPAGGQVQASWTAPADNGDSIDVYHVTLYQDGNVASTVDVGAGTTTRVFDVQNGHDYSVSVVAENRSGESEASPQSAPVTSFGQPAQVGGVSIRPTGTSGQLQVTYGTPSDNGQAIQRFEYQLVSGGTGSGTLGASPATIGGLANGTTYTLQVRACNTYCGAWSATSNGASPYAPPAVPTSGNSSSSANGQTVGFSWNYPANSNGAAITATQVRIDGTVYNVDRTGSRSVSGGWEENHTFQMQVQNEHGQWSGWSAVRNQRAEADPTPPVTIGAAHGDPVTCDTGGACWLVVLTFQNLPQNTYTATMTVNSPNCGNGFTRSYTYTIGGNGSRQSTAQWGQTCRGTVTWTLSPGGHSGSSTWT